MSENTKELKGMLCEVQRCKHCTDNRCNHLTWRDFEETPFLSITTAKHCPEYLPKAPKQFSITLNEDELVVLQELLRPSSDEGESNEDLAKKLYRYGGHNPIAASMYYINVYEIQQCYGGPEEGGWYYYTTNCLASVGYDTFDPNQVRAPEFNYLVDMFIQEVDALPDGDVLIKELDKETIFDVLRERGHYEVAQLDKYGEGMKVVIERQPGAQHDVSRQHYE